MWGEVHILFIKNDELLPTTKKEREIATLIFFKSAQENVQPTPRLAGPASVRLGAGHWSLSLKRPEPLFHASFYTCPHRFACPDPAQQAITPQRPTSPAFSEFYYIPLVIYAQNAAPFISKMQKFYCQTEMSVLS